MAPFLAAIAGAWITDLTIEPAHLEEAFLEYYADDDARERRGLAGATEMPLREEPAQPQPAQPKPAPTEAPPDAAPKSKSARAKPADTP